MNSTLFFFSSPRKPRARPSCAHHSCPYIHPQGHDGYECFKGCEYVVSEELGSLLSSIVVAALRKVCPPLLRPAFPPVDAPSRVSLSPAPKPAVPALSL